MRKSILICTIILIILIILIIIINLDISCITSKNNKEFCITSLLSIIGFFVNLFGIVLGFYLGLVFEEKKREKKLNQITKCILLTVYDKYESQQEYHLRIENRSSWTIHQCGAYLTVNNVISDFLNDDEIKSDFDVDADKFDLFLNQKKGHQLEKQKLSWAAVDVNSKNHHKIDINSGETQDLMVFKFTKNNNLEIASENGYTTGYGTSRCVLRNKDYKFTIRIVSDDTIGKDFNVTYYSEQRTIIINKMNMSNLA